MGRSISTLFMIFVLLPALRAQDRYAAYFADKENNIYSLERPEEFLSNRSILRRTNQDILLDVSDLPVSEAYLSGLREAGITIFYASKWLNAALFQGSSEDSLTAVSLPYVTKVERLADGVRRTSGGRRNFSGERSNAAGNPQENIAYSWHGIDRMHVNGNHGSNMRIAIMDGSFLGADQMEAFRHLRESGKIIMTEDIVRGVKDVYEGPFDHGTRVFSVLAGRLGGQYNGIATESEYLLFRTEDEPTEYRIEEFNWAVAAEKADSAGADVINTSLGYSYGFSDDRMNYSYGDMDGNTTMISRAASKAVATGMMVVASAGNEGSSGWKYITAPADVDGVLTAGAVTPEQEHAAFSSFGPTADGRVKPDAASLGIMVPVINSNGSVVLSSGTSFSSPMLAGLSALMWNENPELTNIELLELIRSSGNQADNPSENLGYGIPFIEVILSAEAGRNQDSFIYPNPVESFLKWETRGPVSRVEIIDLQGKTVTGQSVITTGGADVSSLPAGIYVIRLEAAGTVLHFRFLKK